MNRFEISRSALEPRQAVADIATEAAAAVAEDERQRRRTLLHLRDIALAHGPAKRWASLSIPEGRLQRLEPVDAFASPCGSAGELCAAEGEAALP